MFALQFRTRSLTFTVVQLLACCNYVQASASCNQSLSILAIGDWGGDYHHMNPKTGDCPPSAAQLQAAEGLAKVAQASNTSFVISLGDNIYEDGVQTPKSPRFQRLFEQVYSQSSLVGLPFYVIAGNHDHDGNVSAQIEYSKLSSRWRFPARYYIVTRNWTTNHGQQRVLDLLFIDTVVLVGDGDGPTDVAAANEQWQWLHSTLAASRADFLWVVGHYPVYSAGDDGTQPLLVKALLPLLARHGAHYLSGHDHMFEHIQSRGVNMFVTGTGMECCYTASNIHTVPRDSLMYMISGHHGRGPRIGSQTHQVVHSGFAGINFDDHAHVSFYSQDGETIYVAPPIPRRNNVERPPLNEVFLEI